MGTEIQIGPTGRTLLPLAVVGGRTVRAGVGDGPPAGERSRQPSAVAGADLAPTGVQG